MIKAQEQRSPGAAGGVDVDVSDPERRLSDAARAWLMDAVGRAVGLLGASGEVRVAVVGDAAMAAAHERHAGVPGTTDVLTFDMSEGRGGVLDVDVLVCVDEASRQAAARGHATERELLLYIIHGVLHCLGHDDHDESAAARMHAEEDRVLEALGVGATFARPEQPPHAERGGTPRSNS
jgi:probable rRNA maturation factor